MFVLLAAGCSNELKVTELEPAQGTYMGGEEITIRGNAFPLGRGVQVQFGKHNASGVVIESPTKMKVQTPAGDKNAAVDVTVIFDDGRAFRLPNAFRFIDAQAAGKGMLDKMTNKLNEGVEKKPADPNAKPADPAAKPEEKK